MSTAPPCNETKSGGCRQGDADEDGCWIDRSHHWHCWIKFRDGRVHDVPQLAGLAKKDITSCKALAVRAIHSPRGLSSMPDRCFRDGQT